MTRVHEHRSDRDLRAIRRVLDAPLLPSCAGDVTGHRGKGVDGTSREVRLPPGDVSVGGRSVPAYLTGTVRSQSFSLSQRFNPTGALRPCFMPQPPTGFSGLQSFSRPDQPQSLTAPVALVPLGRLPCRRTDAEPSSTSEPCSGRASVTHVRVVHTRREPLLS